jgi:integrase
MASPIHERNGGYTIQVQGMDGKRRSIRLGKVTKKLASEVKTKVEYIAAAMMANQSLDAETARWLSGISDDLSQKLASAKLIAPRPKALDMAGLLSLYAAKKEAGNKSGTRTNHRTISNDLNRFFKPTRSIQNISEADARAFADHLRDRKLAADTIARRLRRVKSIFAFAVKQKHISENPFQEIRCKSELPQERKAYVTKADTKKLLDSASPVWRTIIALARFAGLRCPSEVFRLKWSDVNFPANRMTISNVKTAGQTGKDYRVCPIFAELRPHLEDAFELAPEGTECVVYGDMPDRIRAKIDGPNGSNDANIRTVFLKLIKRCALQPWPRLFHTLRASAETDLLESFPISAVTEWLGHSATIALKHYTRVPEHLFEMAAKVGAKSGASMVQNVVQTATVSERQETTNATETQVNVGSRRVVAWLDISCQDDLMTLRGFEPRSIP